MAKGSEEGSECGARAQTPPGTLSSAPAHLLSSRTHKHLVLPLFLLPTLSCGPLSRLREPVGETRAGTTSRRSNPSPTMALDMSAIEEVWRQIQDPSSSTSYVPPLPSSAPSRPPDAARARGRGRPFRRARAKIRPRCRRRLPRAPRAVHPRRPSSSTHRWLVGTNDNEKPTRSVLVGQGSGGLAGVRASLAEDRVRCGSLAGPACAAPARDLGPSRAPLCGSSLILARQAMFGIIRVWAESVTRRAKFVYFLWVGPRTPVSQKMKLGSLKGQWQGFFTVRAHYPSPIEAFLRGKDAASSLRLSLPLTQLSVPLTQLPPLPPRRACTRRSSSWATRGRSTRTPSRSG